MRKAVALFLTIALLLVCIPNAFAARTTIIFWHYPQDEYSDAWWEEWIEEYNNSQNEVYVELEWVPMDGWNVKLKGAQAAGTAPDIYGMPLADAGRNVTNGTVLAFDEYVDPAIWEDLTDVARQYTYINGSYWSFPRYLEPSAMLLWRKDLFEAAGLDPEMPPTTWDELIETGKKLKTDTCWGLHIPTNEADIGWTTWGMQYGLSGSLALNDDWSKSRMSELEGYHQLANFFNDVYWANIAPEQAIYGYGSIDALCENRCAMLMTGSWSLATVLIDYPEMVDKIGVSHFPTPDGSYDHATASMGGYCVLMDKLTEHPQECADFLVWMFTRDPAVMYDFFERSHFSKFSPWKSVESMIAQADTYSINPWLETVMDTVIPYSIPEPIYPWEVTYAFGRAVNRILLEGYDAEEALRIADDEVNKYIENFGLAGQNLKN
ncbi:MAG: extracellular solute-binding protein [Clostridia bacterium]|nr:extracellular solute-binding protein [Clostridia bacterium]